MEIHQLRYFVTVAEEGSFSYAAEREHVSQPSLSQQIHKLEEELNQQLFDRLPRQRKPTERSSESCLDFSRIVLCAEQSNMIEMKILRRIQILSGFGRQRCGFWQE